MRKNAFMFYTDSEFCVYATAGTRATGCEVASTQKKPPAAEFFFFHQRWGLCCYGARALACGYRRLP